MYGSNPIILGDYVATVVMTEFRDFYAKLITVIAIAA